MTRARQILFIQGGGAGAYDVWDDKLVESLRRELGGGHEVRYPRMPDEGDPSYARGARQSGARWRTWTTARSWRAIR